MGVEISRLSQRRGRWRHHRSPFISRFPGLRLIQQPGAGRALNSRFLVAENPRADLLLCAKHLLVAAIGRRRAHHAAPRPRRPAGAGSPPPRWWEPLPRLLPGRAKLRSVGTPGAPFPGAPGRPGDGADAHLPGAAVRGGRRKSAPPECWAPQAWIGTAGWSES